MTQAAEWALLGVLAVDELMLSLASLARPDRRTSACSSPW